MRPYTWAEFEHDAAYIAECLNTVIKHSREPVQAYAIYGIPRGGLVLATYLSHALNAPLYTRDSDWHLPVVVVDDNVITGATLNIFAAKAFATATLLQNPNARMHNKTHIFAQVTPEWPVFPWEPA